MDEITNEKTVTTKIVLKGTQQYMENLCAIQDKLEEIDAVMGRISEKASAISKQTDRIRGLID